MKLHGRTKYLLYSATALGLAACTANPQVAAYSSGVSGITLAEEQYWAGLVNFDYNDFYSLTSPNSAGCAGDVMNLYDPISGRSLASNGSSKGGTLLPAFIKNISVDVTDANSTAPTNQAFGCSYGAGTGTIAPTNCATFDYPDDGGVNSNLSGSTLLIGGIQSPNGSGIIGGDLGGLAVSCGQYSTGSNSCATSVYALGVDTLPASAATDPVNSLVPGLESASSAITSYVNLSSATTYSGPQDFIGAAGAYDLGANEFALFGGSSIVGVLGPVGQAATNDTTWVFNLAKQSWVQITNPASINVPLLETFEQDDFGSRNLANQVTARAVFGYAAVQGLAVNAMSNLTNLTSVGGSNAYSTAAGDMPLDSTDRIVITGGDLSSNVVATDAFKFNPTYAPEWVDTLGRALNLTAGTATGENVVTGAIAAGAGEPVQWLQNYHTQPLFNSTPSGTTPLSLLEPSPIATSTPVPILNFGLAPLRDNTNYTGSGYVLYMGGFDMTQTVTLKNPSTESCPGVSGPCAMMINRRSDRALASPGGSGSGESYPSSYSSVGNLPSAVINMTSGPVGSGAAGQSYPTTQLSPSYWDSYTGVAGTQTVPYYGGSTLLPGFNLNTNDVVFFGGADCSNYILSSAVCTSFANPGVYFQMGPDPLNSASGATVPASVGFTATVPPKAAGMAAARGTDPSGNPVIVAFGGMKAAGQSALPAISYLFNAGTQITPHPTWANVTPGGVSPAVVTNGSLVFSHVTKRFYLFGGYNQVAGTQSGDTWELSFAPASPLNCGLVGGCLFTWRQLNVTNGLTCSPNCPTARRSHRMVEVNYSNQNPGGTVGGVTSGESNCTVTSPCSYGMFMEDGTPDGVNPLSDRWMFDPTANDGWGSWQEMREMPARTLAAMSSVDYAIPSTSTTAHRAILFGGETSFADPDWAASTSHGNFVGPTLGDTWMYDYDSSTWNRVQLLGTGYNGPIVYPTSFITDEFQNRQAYNALTPSSTDSRSINAELSELSPPPTSGAMMVTRTLSGPSSATGSPAAALAIPEVYMIGGRLKDGSYQPFDHVYKFCAGTTGEAYSTPSGASWVANTNDFSCDAYNATTNPASPSPQIGYFGRWLRKTPGVTGAPAAGDLSSYMGAAAYDSFNDLIVVWGGLQFKGFGPPFNGADPLYYVTDPASRTAASTNNSIGATIPIYEYTPPGPSVAATSQGTWNVYDKCPASPSAPKNRYGHSMVYDSRHQQLIVVGGYDAGGNPLTENVTNVGGTFTVPDMWTATRVPTGSSGGGPCYNWTQITTLGNSFATTAGSPPQTGLAHIIAAYVPPSGYSTGYYSTYENSCIGVGAAGTDPGNNPNASAQNIGGVYFDIDRTQLGSNENLLLNLTFIPLGPGTNSPDSNTLAQADVADFRIHLVQTGQSASQLQSVIQPRMYTYDNFSNFPEIIQNLSYLSPPIGQPRTEQVLIPLNSNPKIDRIWLERFSGTAILVNASLFRMGQK